MKLELEQVSVLRHGRALLDRVTASLDAGELLALIGPNGAGKTTLLRAVLGLIATSSGRVLLDGTDLTQLTPRERAARVAWLPQHGPAASELSVLEVVSAARYRFDEPPARTRSEAQKALERLAIGHTRERAFATLSGGERQRVALASLIAQQADVLLVDEPGNHLDPAQQIEVYSLLGELWRAGAALVCVTHDVNLLRHLGRSDDVRVAGMTAGRIDFECPLTAPELPERLGNLFGVNVRTLSLEHARVMIPERLA